MGPYNMALTTLLANMAGVVLQVHHMYSNPSGKVEITYDTPQNKFKTSEC